MGDRVARIAAIVAVLALGAIGLALPGSVLFGGVAWLAFLFFALSGWGALVVRVARVADVDVGLRTAWGIAGILTISGPLLMFGVLGRPVLLALLVVGMAGFAWREWTTAEPLAVLARRGLAVIRDAPLLSYVAILVGALVALQVVGAVAHLDRNPWDDDIAYTPFVRRLLDTGDLIEPFSFRRLAAYGGQTVLQGLVGARGNLSSVHALDQGLCFGLVFLLIAGHARTARTTPFWLALVAIAVLLMPDISINTASYWSGAAMFLALYRTVARGDLLVAALIGAAACTLRQNYIPVAALFVGMSLLLSRAPRETWLRAAVIAAGVIVPWCIAAFISSDTFLFPLMKGTWNAGLSLGPSAWTWVDELSLFVTTAIFSQPFAGVLILATLLVVTKDTRPARPLASLFIASLIGFAFLVHSFTDADSQTLWRYAFGYSVPLFCVFALEVGSEHGVVELGPLGRIVLTALVVIQVLDTRSGHVPAYADIVADIREAATMSDGDPTAAVEERRHHTMQATVPHGARLLVMVDDPHYLDFSRNSIANIDVPGFASPGTQMPHFVGSEPLRSYLLAQGYRYVAFVRPERSRYAYRRDFWLWRIFNDAEFFQAMSAYTIDVGDSFAELTKNSTVLHDHDGLVVLDIHRPATTLTVLDPRLESRRRDDYLRELAHREGLQAEWSLTSRRNLIFTDGSSGLAFATPEFDARWNDAPMDATPSPASGETPVGMPPAPPSKPVRGIPVRWMYRRFHLRLRGETNMHLRLVGRVSMATLHTRPRLDVSLDGSLLTSVTVAADGRFEIDLVVEAHRIRDWADLYVVFNAIGQPERDVRELRLARLESVTWEPR